MTTRIRLLSRIIMPGLLLLGGVSAPRAAAVAAGDTVYFRGTWAGPGPGGTQVPVALASFAPARIFPMHGILLEVKDSEDPAHVVKTTMIEGQAVFVAPSSQFSIVVRAVFAGYSDPVRGQLALPGEAAEGAVRLVESNQVLEFLIPDGASWVTTSAASATPVFSMDGAPSRGGESWAQNMSALHGLGAVAGEFMRRTGLEIGFSPLLVTELGTTSPHSHFSVATGKLHIRRDEAFVWDRLSVAAVQGICDSLSIVEPMDVVPSPDGNQYDYNPPGPIPPVTWHNAGLSRRAAFYHGFCLALGVMLTESMTSYAGRFWGLGDRRLALDSPEFESNNVPSRGEDSPRAIAGMIWDLCDVAGDSDESSGVSLKDRSRVDLKKIVSDTVPIYHHFGDFWVNLSDLTPITLTLDSPNFDHIYEKFSYSEVLARWGMAPVLTSPVASQLLTLDPQGSTRLKFKWKQTDTGPESIRGNEFTLALFNPAMDRRLWKKPWFTPASAAVHEYELSTTEMTELNAAVLASGLDSGVLTVIARAPGVSGEVGPVTLSNKVRVYLKPVMRANVIAVDVSRSTPWGDPARSKLQAAADYASSFIPAVTLDSGVKVLQDQISVLSYNTTVGLVSNWADPGPAVAALRTAIPDDSGDTDYPDAFNTALDLLEKIRPPVPSVDGASVEIRKTLTILTDGDYYKPWFVPDEAEAAMWDRLANSGYEILAVEFWSTDGHPPISLGGIRGADGQEKNNRGAAPAANNIKVMGNTTRLTIRDRELPRLLEYIPGKFLPFGQPAESSSGNPLPDEYGIYEGGPEMSPVGIPFRATAGQSLEVVLERPVDWDLESGTQINRDFSPLAIIQAPDGAYLGTITLPTINGEDFESFGFTAAADGEYQVIVFSDPKSAEIGIWSVKVPAGPVPLVAPTPTVFEAARSTRLPDGSMSIAFTAPPDPAYYPYLQIRYSDGAGIWNDVAGLVPVNAAGYALWTDRDAAQAARRFYKADRVPRG